MLIVAPMVNQSDAPFRSLCYKYGATCCYTEMLYSDRIVTDTAYLAAYLPVCDSTYLASTNNTDPKGYTDKDINTDIGKFNEVVKEINTDSHAEEQPPPPPQHPSQQQQYSSQQDLVVQVCGNDPTILSAAVTLIADRQCCCAIDFNLGCPQDRAKQGDWLISGIHFFV